MIRRRPATGWRAAAFAAALFAITLNFLQPLAHASLLRDAGPLGAAKAWASFCLPMAGEDGSEAPLSARQNHECCLGLAHAPVLAEPSGHFALVGPTLAAVRWFSATPDTPSPVGIRDGPSQPRAPPFLA